MKKTFIVGNWKSNKTLQQVETWLAEFSIFNFQFSNKKGIICSPLTLLSTLKSSIINHQSSIRLGAQDISPFEEGAYTGAVSGKQIKEFADYVLIGHSERRKHFGETEEIIVQKIEQALKHDVIPILCVSSLAQISKLKTQNYSSKLKNSGKTMIIAYEPLFAIGSGNPDTPENVESVAKEIKTILTVLVIYGGSVTAKNVKSFTQMPHINGVLVGKASLDPQEFLKIITNA